MERPPKKYVCEKCGYLGDTSEHEGCDYLAWTTGEQLYIDHLERELALLKASPASAPAMSVDVVERLRLNEDDWLFGQTARDARREITTLQEQVEKLTKESGK